MHEHKGTILAWPRKFSIFIWWHKYPLLFTFWNQIFKIISCSDNGIKSGIALFLTASVRKSSGATFGSGGQFPLPWFLLVSTSVLLWSGVWVFKFRIQSIQQSTWLAPGQRHAWYLEVYTVTDTKRRMCGDRIADLEVAFDEPGAVWGVNRCLRR